VNGNRRPFLEDIKNNILYKKHKKEIDYDEYSDESDNSKDPSLKVNVTEDHKGNKVFRRNGKRITKTLLLYEKYNKIKRRNREQLQ